MMELTEDMAELIQYALLSQQLEKAEEYAVIVTAYDRSEDFNAYRIPQQQEAA